jgi:hypothetical protein
MHPRPDSRIVIFAHPLKAIYSQRMHVSLILVDNTVRNTKTEVHKIGTRWRCGLEGYIRVGAICFRGVIRSSIA